MATVTKFFDAFPKIKYDINRNQYPNYEEVTNIFFRIGVIKNTLNNISSYFVYDIEDGDTPEILAEKFYKDAGAAWMILLANDITDAQFDWPLDYKSFEQFIISKYGSVETAKTTPHHYEKVITRRNTRTDVINETRFWVNGQRLTENMLSDVPYSYYNPWTSTTYRTADSSAYEADNASLDLLADLDNGEPFGATLDRGNLALTGDYTAPQTYEVGEDSIEVIVKGEIISCYDHEDRLNDDRKSIKIIKSDYYVQIQDELKYLTGQKPDYLRKLY